MSEIKPGWKRVKFDQMVSCINDRVDDPSRAGVDRYVGLDHLDPECLRIRRWGAPEEVESTKLRFKLGDIIFGKRRAYQRKLAVADFEGICSAHAMVLRAKPKTVLPEFLPFFMQSDLFMERAVAISVGSLSPTINWKTLAMEEFLLPPLGDQNDIATELQALAKVQEDIANSVVVGEQFLEVLTWSLTTGKSSVGKRKDVSNWVYGRLPGITSMPADWTLTKLTDVARLESGHTPSRSKAEYWDGGIPWISLADIKRLGRPKIDATEFNVSSLGISNSSARILPASTVVLSRDASVGYTSIMAEEMATSQHFANFVCGPLLNPLFLFYLFSGMREFWEYTAIGSTNVKTIYMPFFQKMKILLPPRHVQDRIVSDLEITQNAVSSLRIRFSDSQKLLALVRENRLKGVS